GVKPADILRGLYCLIGQVAAAGVTSADWGKLSEHLDLRRCAILPKLMAGKIHFNFGNVDLTLLFAGRAGVADLRPIFAALTAFPAGVVLHFPLAFDAGRAVRKRVQPSDGNFFLASFANPIRSLLDARQRALDLIELPRFQLDELGRNLVAAGIEGDI